MESPNPRGEPIRPEAAGRRGAGEPGETRDAAGEDVVRRSRSQRRRGHPRQDSVVGCDRRLRDVEASDVRRRNEACGITATVIGQAVHAAVAVVVPPELTFLGKALLGLDLVARCLDPSFDPNAAVREHANSIALQRARSGASLRNFAGSLVDACDFMRALPRQAHVILDRLANDGLKVTVEAIDEYRLISGLQKMANRITVGLILAALIVGAALVMRVETTWKLAGYPVLAVLLFVSAALGAAWMAVHILLSDWRSARHPARSTRHSA